LRYFFGNKLWVANCFSKSLGAIHKSSYIVGIWWIVMKFEVRFGKSWTANIFFESVAVHMLNHGIQTYFPESLGVDM
jgi:hypothetical protein